MKLAIENQIQELHQIGKTQKEMAKILKCSITTIRRKMRELKLYGKSKGTRKYKINEDVFKIIDTEEKAYWLGFLLADGCIAKSGGTKRAIRVFLKRGDMPHLKKLAKFFNYKGKFHPDNRDNHPRVGIVFNSIKLCRSLINSGWMEYKQSGDCSIINTVPPILFNHFIRGYFDGDGCISYGIRKSVDGGLRPNKDWYINIVCKYEAPLVLFGQKLEQVWGEIKKPYRRKSVYSLTYNGNNKLVNFLDWLYSDATVYLDRKFVRKLEFSDTKIYSFNNIWDFEFIYSTNHVINRKDCSDIVDGFTDRLINSGWANPTIDASDDWDKCKSINIDRYIVDNHVRTGLSPGNRIIEKFQPSIWYVAINNNTAIAEFTNNRKMVKKAVNALLTTPNKHIYPRRLIREMLFAGFTRASLTSVPVFLAAIKLFKLSGNWYDPCAGWGNRLIASYLAGIDYECTDPGVSYDGLVKIAEEFNINATINNNKWQDHAPKNYDFMLTSPPFWNKENYLDGVDYGLFDKWYKDFIVGLIESSCGRTILHVDNRIKNKLVDDFDVSITDVASINRSKAPTEFFVEIFK